MNTALRVMVEADLPTVLEWRNAEDVRRNMYTNHLISRDEHRAWWNVQRLNPEARLLIFEIDGVPSGAVTFSRYTGEDGTATWAFYSGDRSRRGVGAMMERAALEYAFETLRVRKLECEVLSFNRAVVGFHVKHGFTVEGVFRQAYERDEQFFDIYRLSMLRTEWLKHVKPSLEVVSRESLAGRQLDFPLDVSDRAIEDYASATGDRNPIHFDDAYAQSMGFPGRIAHGMLVGSALSRIFGSEFPGDGTVYVSQTMEFVHPLQVNGAALIRLKVVSHIGRRIQVETSAVQGDKVCVKGVAVLMMSKGCNGFAGGTI